MPSPLPRRTLLRLAGAGAVLTVPGCGLLDRGDDAPPTPDPDDVLRATAATDEAALLARYDAVLARHPGLTPRLGALRDNHARHLATLVAPLPSPTASAAPVPTDPRAALRDLLVLERAASAARTTWARTAGAPELVGLLGSLAACEATHALVLAQP